MKTITKFFLLAALIVAFASHAQAQATIDFETVGNTWTWTVFANGAGGGDDASLLTIPANNPTASGINTSAHCAKLVNAATAQPWGGTFSTGIGSITFTSSNCIVKVMVYKDVISNFNLKFEGGTGGATSIETQVPNTKTNQWEELTFDLTGQIGKTYTQITIIPDFPTARTAGSINYFDNISFNAGSSNPPSTGPTTTLTPTVAAGKALFTYNSSGAYTNAALLSMNTANAWGGLFISSSYAIGGKNVICLTPSSVGGGAGVYYHGGDLASTMDVSGMKYLHVDVWVPAALEFTNLGVSPISTGGNQYLYNLESATGFTKGSWSSIDIPLTTFSAAPASPVNLASVFQFIVKSDQAATITSIPNNTIYVDNIYYWTDVTVTLTVSATSVSIAQPANSTGTFNVTATQNWTAASDQTWLTVSPTSGTLAGATVTCTAAANTATASRTATVTITGADATVKTVSVTQAGLPIPASPVPTSVAADVLSVYSDTYTAAATNLQFQNWFAAPWSTITLASGGSAQMIGATADGAAGGIQIDNLNVSAMSFIHFDVYPTTGTTSIIKYNVVPVGGGGTGWTFFTGLVANQWNKVNVPVSTLGLPGTSVFQIGFGTFGGFGTFYVDNIFFSKTASAISEVLTPSVKCYMNSGELIVSSPETMSEVTVRNLLGQNVRTATVNANSKVFDLSDLAAGNYIVVAKMTSGMISSQKFIKN